MLPYMLTRVKPRARIGYLVDVEYIGRRGKAALKFLDVTRQRLFRWYDNTGHLSYLLTDAPTEAVESILFENDEYIGCEEVEKFDAIKGEHITVRKPLGKTPLAIGGESERARQKNFRDLLESNGYNVWEAWVRYVNTYAYDNKFEIGMPYIVTDDEIIPYVDDDVEVKIQDTMQRLAKRGIEYTDALHHWVRLFEYDLPKVDYVALDIEVMSEDPNIIPNPIIASDEVIATSLVGSDGRRDVFVLRRQGVEMGRVKIDGRIHFFDTERDLVIEIFRVMMEYPFVMTFNGDNFDLMYLYNRAKRLMIPSTYCPIYVVRKLCKITTGIHIDLYHFFKNRSIQNYAFGGKYKAHGLDDIAMAILGRGKIKIDKSFADQSHTELGNYCLNDGILTYDLCSFAGNTTLNLILSLARMANLNFYELTRRPIGDWVKSSFYYLLRKRNWIIPNKKDLMGRGEIQTAAKIVGKKYQGAIVEEPVPGIHFNVVVTDFQSLYPSEMKERNIGYSTMNCGHEECLENLVPDTTHHICTKRRAIEADAIGGLRDIRVFLYKPLSKEPGPRRAFYDCLQQAIKVYINASYGVFGYEKFGLYCPPVAEAVTAFSRRDMLAALEKARELAIEVLGGDTDSVFLKDPTVEQINALQEWAMDVLKLDLGVDKVYRYVIFSRRKKNYLGIFEDGRADIKGLTGKKRHTPDVIKKPFYEIIDMLGAVYDMDSYYVVRDEIREKIFDIYLKIANREWDSLDELAFHMGLGKDLDQYQTNPQHVKAARMMADLGFDVRGGMVIHFIKATNEGGVMPLIDADPKYVDVDNYLEHVKSIFKQITDPMDINLDVTLVKDGDEGRLRTQVHLADFMR